MKVAVYGSLRQGLYNHKYHLTNSKYLGTFESLPVYQMVSMGTYPAIAEGGNISVTMEVYEISLETLHGLDRLEGYSKGRANNHYERKAISTPYGKALVYFYKDMAGEKGTRVESGDWKEFLKNKHLYANA